MSRLIAIDPGVRMCGYAIFNKRKLAEAGIVRTKYDNLYSQVFVLTNLLSNEIIYSKPCVEPFNNFVIELPVVYDKKQQKGDPNDLIRLAFVAGAITRGLCGSHFPRALTPTPREWKGTLKKEIHHERIKRACPEAEPIALKTAKTYRHNVYDAIGLGLWALERIDK